MIDLKSILIENIRVISIKVQLPFTCFIFIYHSKGFICGETINIKLLTNEICICKMKESSSIDQLLNSEVIECNQIALNKGITIGMKGKEALLKM